ncbi:V-type proton ATPase proteolipid subunit 2 [Vanrija pseudolonga]|uniref:V-type proton ATPase proteolipid subunit n=1 Tax=Vanrija pseudolonga TaxID=143232 RepID=A0AAF0Y516_9TREE|nr:V-type proton ATPase proteolipid subunit 2 [Vanrija pseudolonga]
MTTLAELSPPWAPFFGFAGVTAAISLSTVGAAFGTSKSGIGIAGLGPFRPDLMMKALIPVVVIIAVYGLVVSVLIAGNINPGKYTLFQGFIHLAAGLSCGFTGMAAGYAIGVVGDACVRVYLYENRVYVTMVLILIFAVCTALSSRSS